MVRPVNSCATRNGPAKLTRPGVLSLIGGSLASHAAAVFHRRHTSIEVVHIWIDIACVALWSRFWTVILRSAAPCHCSQGHCRPTCRAQHGQRVSRAFPRQRTPSSKLPPSRFPARTLEPLWLANVLVEMPVCDVSSVSVGEFQTRRKSLVAGASSSMSEASASSPPRATIPSHRAARVISASTTADSESGVACAAGRSSSS